MPREGQRIHSPEGSAGPSDDRAADRKALSRRGHTVREKGMPSRLLRAFRHIPSQVGTRLPAGL